MDPSIHGSIHPWIHPSMDPAIQGSNHHGSNNPWVHSSSDPNPMQYAMGLRKHPLLCRVWHWWDTGTVPHPNGHTELQCAMDLRQHSVPGQVWHRWQRGTGPHTDGHTQDTPSSLAWSSGALMAHKHWTTHIENEEPSCNSGAADHTHGRITTANRTLHALMTLVVMFTNGQTAQLTTSIPIHVSIKTV